jgi:hypothetical protein
MPKVAPEKPSSAHCCWWTEVAGSAALRELDSGLWVLDTPLSVYGVEIGTRTTVIRLEDGGLFIHSPSGLDPALRDELAALGPVRCVVAPNKLHYFWVADYASAFGDARFFAAPGLPEKRPELRFDAVLGSEAPADWAGQIEQVEFRGAPIVNEIAFFHPSTRTLILTDLAFNVQHTHGALASVFFRLNDAYRRFGPSRMMRATMRDRAAARASIEQILRWDFDRVIVAHGVVLQRSGKRLLREAYAWLLE